jgi:hypothetical protein
MMKVPALWRSDQGARRIKFENRHEIWLLSTSWDPDACVSRMKSGDATGGIREISMGARQVEMGCDATAHPG